jgi:hypothetical protein
MAYSDLNKRRAATKLRTRRYRERLAQARKALGVTSLDLKASQVDTQGVTESVTLPDLDADGQPIPEL